MKSIEEIIAGLIELEREWILGWEGPPGAAYNVIATGLVRRGLLKSHSNWELTETGLAVRDSLLEQGTCDENKA